MPIPDVERSRSHPHKHFVVPGNRTVHLAHLQHVWTAIPGLDHRPHSRCITHAADEQPAKLLAVPDGVTSRDGRMTDGPPSGVTRTVPWVPLPRTTRTRLPPAVLRSVVAALALESALASSAPASP